MSRHGLSFPVVSTKRIDGVNQIDIGLYERAMVATYFGPLTAQDHNDLCSYEAHCALQDQEHELEQQHGGRSRCAKCDQFTVDHVVVNVPFDPTSVGICRNPTCEYIDYPGL